MIEVYCPECGSASIRVLRDARVEQDCVMWELRRGVPEPTRLTEPTICSLGDYDHDELAFTCNSCGFGADARDLLAIERTPRMFNTRYTADDDLWMQTYHSVRLSSVHGERYMIERCDESEVFASDEEAVGYIKGIARAPGGFAGASIAAAMLERHGQRIHGVMRVGA